ncbi:hypothetical protein RAM07_03830 [Lactobacillus helsingborgensis]|uniref:hypothetical protein n=1 Tax=Lactobacillus helsingborgensis TaxID=1218494 RepID=UPI00274238B8|nr:hypothetical protein [Lactobacillus helsingborgensis]WLT01083.1 hypothetical protein RAM07_03830 [Lactobacillus helsingborgensis]
MRINKKVKGFFIAESMVALMIALMGVTTLALIVGESRQIEQNIEHKTDFTYAWHVMRKNNLKKIVVHDHVYYLTGKMSVYDETNEKTYQIRK